MPPRETPKTTASDSNAARLQAYRAGYRPDDAPALQDAGARASDRYVAAHDPLRGRLRHPAHPGVEADLVLGVEPGRYFCGGLAHALATGYSQARCGFIHVPPDAMLARPAHLDLTGVLMKGLLSALQAEKPFRRVLVTGFGAFPGVADNPTAAWVADAERLAGATAGLEAAGVVLGLEDGLGGVWPGMGPVISQVEGAIARHGMPEVIVALGVDSRQALPRPRFTIETQSRGKAGVGAAGDVSFEPLEAFALALLRARTFSEE